MGIYTPWTLLFSKKERTGTSYAFGSINERQISLTYIKETVSMIGFLRDFVFIYK